ncbi:TonB-dependent receptor domain-containing protein [Chitinophaga silvisoli]|uniref:TonB-dependent receptor n=1 Tax=Chitinophaga silvisoli TaxID=2291814 RepID=A0A3E1NS83_9BACT|nr:TonB-dependent receptor [Chitinophaga silvisoli]RFM30811.1 TonB-dependent receptor [Chitinophaga silvisoli]
MKQIHILLLTLLPLFAVAQSNISGTVTDAEGHLLDGVTITLSQQNKYIATAITDLGHFTLKGIAKGNYTLAAMSMGYQSYMKELAVPTDSISILLQADHKQLQGITVSAAKPVIERKTDRVVFNVENSIIANGGTSWEALTKAPGVSVNSDNSISAYRKGVEVYMDGKPLHLSGDDLVSYLQGLPSSMVTRIEVLTNPPASFEAQGGSIINIVTKKVKKQGLNVAFNGNYIQGIYSSYNGSATFNYRQDKVNVYGNYGYGHKHTYMDNRTNINFGDSYWETNDHNVLNSNSHNYRLGVDYQLADNQILGVLFTGNNRAGHSDGDIPTRILSADKSNLDSTLQTNSTDKKGGSGYTYNINYSLKLDSGKRSVNLDLDYAPYETSSYAHINSTSSSSANDYRIYTPTTQHIDIFSGKADYTYSLGKWNMSSGFKYSSIKSDNLFTFIQSDVLMPDKSNHFEYTENTTALYTNISGTFNKLTVQGGLRAENTNTRGYSITLDSLNKRSYFKLFPTVFLQYKINDNNQLQLTYGYRIDRPEYARMNPARHYSSPYNYYVGNPSLQPAFVHNVEVGYTYKENYTLTANYTSTSNIFTNVTVQDNNTKNYYITHQNLGLSVNAGLRIAAAFHPTSWWDINVDAGGYYTKEKSAYLQSHYNFSTFSYDGRLNQSFTINKKKGIAAEVTAQYIGPGIQNIYRFESLSEIDLGVKANVLKGKGTVRLTANDIFNAFTYRVNINYLDQQSSFYHKNESRLMTLSFSYRMGKDIKAARSRKTASEEEKQRAQ